MREIPWRCRRIRDGPRGQVRNVRLRHRVGWSCACSVSVMIEIRRILCPVDFSDPSLRALRHASTLAGWYESALDRPLRGYGLPIDNAEDVGAFGVAPTAVLAAARSTRVVDDLHGFVARVLDGRGVDVEVEEARSVADAIVKRAVTLAADLIVMGTHGRTGMRRAKGY